MPTLFRLVFFMMIMAVLIYGAMFSLATFVKPTQTQMTIRLPLESLVN
ncbi:histidine kinase [Limoniibacter endophyticus]|nr:histidine kinase [Limoniibacter endophyticus]